MIRASVFKVGITTKTFWWMGLSFAAVLIFESIPEWHFWQSTLKNLGHGFVFALAALVVLSLRRSIHLRSLMLMGLFVFGALVEWVQPYFGRSNSVNDIINNGVGICCGLSGYVSVKRRSAAPLALIGVMASLTFLIYPLTRDGFSAYRQSLAFPVLYQESWGMGLKNLNLHYGAEIACEQEESICSTARLDKGPYPSVALSPIRSDWRHFERLEVVLEVLSEGAATINLRIHDRWHNNQYSDRFNRSYVLSNGLHQIEVPLAWLIDKDRSRALDLEHIRQLLLFKTHQEKSFNLRLIEVRLQPSGF